MIFQSKKGFLLRDFVVTSIIFGLIVALFIIQVTSLASNYGNTEIIDPTFTENYNKLQNNLDQLDVTNQAVQGSGGLNLIGAFDIAFNSVFTAIVMVWQGILLYTGMAFNLSNDFSFIDQQTVYLFVTGIIAILTTYLIFIWLSSVSRGKI
jgi:hypothetical protein